MKNLILNLTALLLLPTLIYTAPSQGVLERTITGAHTKTFSVENLFKNPLDAREWNDVIAATGEFVKEHHDSVKNQRDKGITSSLTSMRSSTVNRNKLLMQSYDAIKAASDELVKTIKAAYNEIFRSATTNEAVLVEKFSKKFGSIYKRMAKLTQELENERDDLKDAIINENGDTKKKMLKEQKQVVTVLHRLALTLELTAKKAGNDLRK